jgi:hypothetical protein
MSAALMPALMEYPVMLRDLLAMRQAGVILPHMVQQPRLPQLVLMAWHSAKTVMEVISAAPEYCKRTVYAVIQQLHTPRDHG